MSKPLCVVRLTDTLGNTGLGCAYTDARFAAEFFSTFSAKTFEHEVGSSALVDLPTQLPVRVAREEPLIRFSAANVVRVAPLQAYPDAAERPLGENTILL